jgi:hypothetical protein
VAPTTTPIAAAADVARDGTVRIPQLIDRVRHIMDLRFPGRDGGVVLVCGGAVPNDPSRGLSAGNAAGEVHQIGQNGPGALDGPGFDLVSCAVNHEGEFCSDAGLDGLILVR